MLYHTGWVVRDSTLEMVNLGFVHGQLSLQIQPSKRYQLYFLAQSVETADTNKGKGLWLQDRLLTQQVHTNRGCPVVPGCLLCDSNVKENRDHLLWHCAFSRRFWQGLLAHYNIAMPASSNWPLEMYYGTFTVGHLWNQGGRCGIQSGLPDHGPYGAREIGDFFRGARNGCTYYFMKRFWKCSYGVLFFNLCDFSRTVDSSGWGCGVGFCKVLLQVNCGSMYNLEVIWR